MSSPDQRKLDENLTRASDEDDDVEGHGRLMQDAERAQDPDEARMMASEDDEDDDVEGHGARA